jgi:hypothetical protein
MAVDAPEFAKKKGKGSAKSIASNNDTKRV